MTTAEGGKILIAGAERILSGGRERHCGMTDPAFEQLLVELRPKLHRYCARMTGSVIDGEDVLQEALVKAVKARPQRRRDRAARSAGSFASHTMPRSISCGGGRGPKPGSRMRIPK